MLYLFGRLALSDSYYFQQEEEAFDYQQRMNDHRPEGPQPDPRAAVVDRRVHLDGQHLQASCAAAGRAS